MAKTASSAAGLVLPRCSLAAVAEEGRAALAEGLSPDSLHQKCKGWTSTGQMCSCRCHEAIGVICLTCHARIRPEESAPGKPECFDADACAARLSERLSGNETYRQIQAIRREAEARRESDRSTRPPRAKRAGRCEHCGAETAGGRFLPGHDAKLKGHLISEADGGSIDAVAELRLRKWVVPERFPELWEASKHKMYTEAWLQGRIEGRTS